VGADPDQERLLHRPKPAVMADRFSRFLRLERPRRAEAPSEPQEARGRFDAVEVGEEPILPSSVPSSAMDRFRTPKGSGLALESTPDGEQPFIRCAACEADNARHEERCLRCGVDLKTPEQRLFNQRLWASRQQESEEEARILEEHEALARATAEAARARRAEAEIWAEELLRHERERTRGHALLRLVARIGEFLSARRS
jgi:hypothetical protein